MSRVTGTINIDFETDKELSEKEFDLFEQKVRRGIGEWIDMQAEECGFESQEIHSALVDDMDCEY